MLRVLPEFDVWARYYLMNLLLMRERTGDFRLLQRPK